MVICLARQNIEVKPQQSRERRNVKDGAPKDRFEYGYGFIQPGALRSE
jgi:hypothetical protein